MKKPIIYEIAEKRLALRTMVLGQLESLAAFLKQEGAEELSKLFSEGVNPADVNKLLFDVLSARKVADLLAIILCEEGQRIEEKDENALATFIRNNMTVEELGTVLSDFFTVHGLASQLPKMPEISTTNQKESKIPIGKKS